jgi:hypothetical protein
MKKNQQGSAGIIALAIVGVIVAALVALVIAYFSASNWANRQEALIKAAYEDNQNVLANYSQKVMTSTQIPEMAKNDMAELVKASISGRYGPDGSRAAFLSIKEQNPTLDTELYRKLMNMIEAGRDEFKNAQTRLIDVKRAYEVGLNTAPRSFFLSFGGYPHIDLDKYKIVKDDHTEETFRTGKEKTLQLRPQAAAAHDAADMSVTAKKPATVKNDLQ